MDSADGQRGNGKKKENQTYKLFQITWEATSVLARTLSGAVGFHFSMLDVYSS